MALTISNLRISPFSQKDVLKPVFGDRLTLSFAISGHQTGDTYEIGFDHQKLVYPPSRPLCAGTTLFTLSENCGVLTFNVDFTTSRMRDWVNGLRKPTPIFFQVVRMRAGKATTLVLDDLLALPSVIDGAITVCEGDPLADRLAAKLDKPAVEGTSNQILSKDANGRNVWRNEQLFSDYATKAYVDGKVEDCGEAAETALEAHKSSNSAHDTLFAAKANTVDLTAHTGNAAVHVTAADKTTWNAKADMSDIPTKVGDLTNDSGYQTASDVSTAIADKADKATTLAGYGIVDAYDKTEADGRFVEKETGKGLSTNDFSDAEKSKLSGIAAGAEVNVQTDWNQSDATKADYLKNKPDMTSYVEKETGKGLSTNDFTTAEKDKLSGIASGAEVNVQADWSEEDTAADDYIKNKPVLATVATTGSYADLSGKPEIPSTEGFATKEYVDAKDASKAYLDYLCIANATDAENTVSIYCKDATGMLEEVVFEWSKDLATWTSCTPSLVNGSTTAVATLAAGERIYLRGDNASWSKCDEGYTTKSQLTFTASGMIDISGNIMSLVDKTCKSTVIPCNGCFYGLFMDYTDTYEQRIHDVSGLKMPATSLTVGCYASMFVWQRNAIGWENLVLPAKTLAAYCYKGTFQGIGRSAAPVNAPRILATTLASNSLNQTFVGSYLSNVEVLFTDWDDSEGATTRWLNAPTPAAIVKIPSALSVETRDDSHIPAGSAIVYSDVAKTSLDAIDGADYLCFTAKGADETIKLNRSVATIQANLEYSTDKKNWTTYTWTGTDGYTISLSNAGDVVYMRGDNDTFSISPIEYFYFVTTNVAVSGNVMSLADKTCTAIEIPGAFYFFRLFWSNTGCGLQVTDALKLPAKILKNACYGQMFMNCNLDGIPQFSIGMNSNNAINSFYGMFSYAHCNNMHDIDFREINGYNLQYTFFQSHILRSIRVKAVNMAFDYAFSNSTATEITLDVPLNASCFATCFQNCPLLEKIVLYIDHERIESHWFGDSWLSGTADEGVVEMHLISRSTEDDMDFFTSVPMKSGWTLKIIPDYKKNAIDDFALTNRILAKTSSENTVFPSTSEFFKMTCNGSMTLAAASVSSSLVAYSEIVLDVASGGSVTAGTNLTFVDTPEAGKRNICVVRWSNGAAKLYVVIKEDL